MVQTGAAKAEGKQGSKGPSPEKQELVAQRALAAQLEDEILRLEQEISSERSRQEKVDPMVLEARSDLEAERLKWIDRYQYPSGDFQSFQEAVDKSAVDGRVLEIVADATLESEPIVLRQPCRLLGCLVDSRRPVLQCNKLQIKGDKDVDIWITGLEIAGFPMNEEEVTNTREMRTITDKYQQKARDALSPSAKRSRGEDVRCRSAILELNGSVEFHISDCVIHGEGRHGIEAGGKCDMRGSGLELTEGLVVGISVLDESNVFLERAHVQNCRCEGVHVATAGSLRFECGTIGNCEDGFRIFGEQCTSSNIMLGPDATVHDCTRHGIRLNIGASASWAGGKISSCNSGAVHAQTDCMLDGWQEGSPYPESSSKKVK